MNDNYIISNAPTTAFGGIYSLIDENGKRYIGSSKNIKKRVAFHSLHFKLFLRDGADGYVNPAMKDALKKGCRFRCEVLASFNCELSSKELREIERVFIVKYGGYDVLYNHSIIPHKI